MSYKGLCHKLCGKLYILWLMFINFVITSACLGTIVWGGFRLIMHPMTYTMCLEIGVILAGFDLLYNLINIRKLG